MKDLELYFKYIPILPLMYLFYINRVKKEEEPSNSPYNLLANLCSYVNKAFRFGSTFANISRYGKRMKSVKIGNHFLQALQKVIASSGLRSFRINKIISGGKSNIDTVMVFLAKNWHFAHTTFEKYCSVSFTLNSDISWL